MILVILVILLMIGLGIGGEFFYRKAVALNDKEFIGQAIIAGVYPLDDPWRTERMWYEKANHQILTIQSTDNLILSAIYLAENPDSKKVALLAHGYTGNLKEMAPYAKRYAEMGFNVLVPDARGHGESEGNYIGFGWHERKDYLQWIQLMLEKVGKDTEIALFGISMGGATVMNVSGEPLPANVKVIVEDCGYSSVTGELAHQLKEMYHLPAFPLVLITSLITKIRSNYWFSEASSVNQVKKNKFQCSLSMVRRIHLFQQKCFMRYTKRMRRLKRCISHHMQRMQKPIKKIKKPIKKWFKNLFLPI